MQDGIFCLETFYAQMDVLQNHKKNWNTFYNAYMTKKGQHLMTVTR